MKTIRESVLTWRGLALGLLALGFWVWAYPSVVRAVYPASWRLDVRAIIVNDSRDGQSPTVVVDRSVNSTFMGSYAATLRRIDADGVIWAYCGGERLEIPFQKGAEYPGRDMNWWLGHPPADACNITPGQYTLRIVWTLPTLPGVTTTVTRESAPFWVFDPIPPAR